MIHITINDNLFESNIDNSYTILSFIDYLTTKNINTAGHIVTEIKINEDHINLDKPDARLESKMKDVHSLAIKTKSSIELAFEAIESIPEYIDSINSQIETLIQEFRSGDEEMGNNHLAEAIETIELFIQLFTGIQNSLIKNLPSGYQKSETISTLEIKLLEIVKELIIAKTQNDTTLLCDLLEYELVDNLIQWKDKVVPILLGEKSKL